MTRKLGQERPGGDWNRASHRPTKLEVLPLTPGRWGDLEAVFGITEGNIFHGDLRPDQLFFMRPLPSHARYATPIRALYLCGAGTHPGGGVTGAPGYNAAHRILSDLPRLKRA